MTLIAGDHAHVIVNLAAWTAGAGISHLPEIIFRAELVDAIFRYMPKPQIVSFNIARNSVFAFENRYVQLFFFNSKPLRRSNQLPRVGDGILLEVIAKRKIPQHLKKRVMAVGEADVFQIVMLAAGAHALLRGGCPHVVAFFQAEKDVFELVHPRVCKEQRRVVRRDERRGVHLAVSLLNEEVQELAANFGACKHEGSKIGEHQILNDGWA